MITFATDTPLNTASLSVGRVMHSRRRPIVNSFVYPTFYLTFNVARLDALDTRWFGVNRFNLLSLHERDHGARDGTALEPWARKLLADHDIDADGDIYLHCYPRLFGFAFNPVAFWYCYRSRGDKRELAAVIAEVNNTFGERHNYIVAHTDGRPIRAGDVLSAQKCFHVSPFCDVTGHYRFRFDVTTTREHVVIEYHDNSGEAAIESQPLLLTSVIGWSRPLSPASIRDAVAGQPLMTFMLLARIHWQAVRLWIKKVKFYRKPNLPLKETTR